MSKNNNFINGVKIIKKKQIVDDRGKILQVGPGKKDQPMQCEVGDVVAYPKNMARKVEVDGNDYYVIRETELLMIISRGDK